MRTLLVFALLLCQAFSLVENSSLSNSLRGSRSGIVPIYKINEGFYIEGDFAYDSNSSTNQSGPYTYPMMLGLYTSQSLLVYNCLDFSYYDCKSFNCETKPEVLSETYPYFTASGLHASSPVYVEYNHWSLKSESMIATACSSKALSYGSETYGIIGLGVEGTSSSNFFGNPLFAIYLQRDLKNGTLMFTRDERYLESPFPVTEIKTNENWRAEINGSLHVGVYNHNITANLIFDINADAIGLPSDLYFSVLSFLKHYGVVCDENILSQPTCSYNGSINNLPALKINNGSCQIPISPEVYIQNVSNDTASNIVLNLRAIGESYEGKSYVTPSYSNTIILDSHFMSHYYTVFEGKSSKGVPKITLYKSHPDGTNSIPTWILITLGAVAFLLLAIICNCCFKKRSKRRVPKRPGYFGTQAPLIINAQKVEYIQPVAYVHHPNYAQSKTNRR